MIENKQPRSSAFARKTGETEIGIKLDIDGQGNSKIATGVPFLDHMLNLFAVHGFFDLEISAKGDIEVDYHHTVEDVGICLGKSFGEALGNKGGINRYGMSYLPMDETLVRAVVDISNRPYLHYQVKVPDQKVGNFDTCLAQEFLRAFAFNAGITLHVDLLHGENSHHIIEAVFKALGRAMNEATKRREGSGNTALSSKGCL